MLAGGGPLPGQQAVAAEGVEEGDDVRHLPRAQGRALDAVQGPVLAAPGRQAAGTAQLGAGHDAHHFLQPIHRAVVQPGAGEGHVAQGGHTPDAPAAVFQQQGVLVLVGRGVGREMTARGLAAEQAGVAEGRPLVAEDAADGLEQGHAPQLGLAEGGGVAADEAVIGAVRGDQGALEGGQGLGDAVEGDLAVAEGPGEVPAVAGVGGEAPFRLAGAVQVHFHGVEDGALGLLLKGRGAAVPEQHRLEGRVPYRRRVARAALPRFPQGGGAPVAAGLGVEVVAGTAGLGALAREAGFVEETFAQGDLGGVARVVGRLRRL